MNRNNNELAAELYCRIQKSISKYDTYDVSLVEKNGRKTIVVKRLHYTGISHYVVKEIESILKEYKLIPVFYYIEINLEEGKPIIEITIA